MDVGVDARRQRRRARFIVAIAGLAGGLVGVTGAVSPAAQAGALPVQATALTQAAAAGQAPSFVSLSPARLMDTRAPGGTVDGDGPVGIVGPGGQVVLPVAGRGGVPASGVDAVVLNVTAVGASAPTFLTVWPTTSAQPLASNLNPNSADPLANLVTVKLGGDGSVSLFNAVGAAHLLADVTGYFRSGGGFVATSPTRLADTRSDGATVDGGGPHGALGPDSTVRVEVSGRAAIPANATGVLVNLTAVNATAPTFLTVWPSGQSRPLASSLNPANAAPLANHVTSGLGADGAISVYNAVGNVDVVVDVAGYFTGGDELHPLTPARIADTRLGVCMPLNLRRSPGYEMAGCVPLEAAREYHLRVTGRGGVPAAGVGAVVLNVTAVNATRPTFVALWPTSTPQPWASNLNPLNSQPVANQVIAKVGLEGSVSIINALGAVDLIVDVVGWLPADPNQPYELGALEFGTRKALPTLAAGDLVRYRLNVAAGHAFSIAADPMAAGDIMQPCGDIVTVRRPDGTAVGSGSDCGVNGGATVDIDVVADQSGTWFVDYMTVVDRQYLTANLLASTRVHGGTLPLGTTRAFDLHMGQNSLFSVTATAGQPLSAALIPANATGVMYGPCDVGISLWAPDGTLAGSVQAGPTGCSGSFGLPTPLVVTAPAAAAGVYVIEVDNGGAAARSGLRVMATQPIDGGSVAVPGQVSQLLGVTAAVRWSVSLNGGDHVHVSFTGLVANGCMTYTLRQPDGTVEQTRNDCSGGYGTLLNALDAVATVGGNWTVTVENDGSIEATVTANVSLV